MISKVYEKIKEILRNNYVYVILFFVLYVGLMFPVPYYVEAPGGIIDITDKVEVENQPDTEGSYNMAYVTEYEGTVFTMLLSYILPDWDLVKIESEDVNENEEATYTRNHLMLEEANQTAVMYAYQKAEKEVTITSEAMYVSYLDPEVDWELKVGDILRKADGKEIESKEQFTELIEEKEVGDSISLEVERDGKEEEVSVKVREVDGEKLLGVVISYLREIETDPEVTFHFSEKESGPSAGFMTALTIYQALIDEDLTNGLKIVGTGTIDQEGNVGSIGGVKYKLMGAVRAKADVFFVPAGENYEEAKKIKEDKGYDIELVKVETFDDALSYLEKQKD